MLKFKKSDLKLMMVIVGSLTISSYGHPQSQENIITDTEKLTLIYWQPPTILNPHLSTGFKDSEASRITLEPLATFNKEGVLIPILAEEIPTIENGGIAEDGLSVTWKLRQDVRWSDGEKFTADDVVFTYEFITNPAVESPTKGDYAMVETMEAIDEYTVKVTFQNVTPPWYSVLVGGGGMILPRHLYQPYNNKNAREAPYNSNPVGTGAYMVAEFEPDESVVFHPNPYYRYPQKQNFQRVKIKSGEDATAAARAVLETGEADFAHNLQVDKDLLKKMAQQGKGKLLVNFGSQSERILINFTDPNQVTSEGENSSLQFPHPFLSDTQVRQALALAVDKSAIADNLYGIMGQPTSNYLLAPPEFISDNNPLQFNLNKASQILDEAGWIDHNDNGIREKNGVEMRILFQTTLNPIRQQTQAIIKQNWQSLGVAVDLKTVDANKFFSSDTSEIDGVRRFSADVQMFTTGNISPDPTAYFKNYTCDNIPQKSNNWSRDNYSRYCNPEYDQMFQSVLTELDPQIRASTFKKLNDLLIQEAVVIPLIHRADVVGVANNLYGVELTPWDMKTWNIADWKKF